jgi:MFS family permease
MTQRVFRISALSMFTSMLGIGIITPFPSLCATKMRVGVIWLGMIFTSYGLASTIVNPIAGRLSDRAGRKRFLMFRLFVYSLSSLGYMYAGNAPGMALVRLVQGAAGGYDFPGGDGLCWGYFAGVGDSAWLRSWPY